MKPRRAARWREAPHRGLTGRGRRGSPDQEARRQRHGRKARVAASSSQSRPERAAAAVVRALRGPGRLVLLLRMTSPLRDPRSRYPTTLFNLDLGFRGERGIFGQIWLVVGGWLQIVQGGTLMGC